MPRLFVYGTLLRGEANHHFLTRSLFVCQAKTEPLYSLFHLGGFPAMSPHGSTSVVGEVYEVEKEVLEVIDDLEGHPEWYTRAPIRLAGNMTAETYLMDPALLEGIPLIVTGDWRRPSADLQGENLPIPDD